LPYNGSGTYTRPAGQPVAAGTIATDTVFNTYTADVATALTNCVTRDGQSPATANLPMGGNKITGLSAATLAGDAARYDELLVEINARIASDALLAPLANPTFTGTPAAPTPAGGTNTTQIATTAFIQAAIASLQTPPGTIIDFASNTPPTGYLACPQVATAISRAAYPALFAAIGTTWGSGDGVTTFGMPYFPADYATVQGNSVVGTTTTGAILAHTHVQQFFTTTPSGLHLAQAIPGNSATISNEGLSTSSTGGSANLTAGVRVLKCVKV
jgi:hypothetical protein